MTPALLATERATSIRQRFSAPGNAYQIVQRHCETHSADVDIQESSCASPRLQAGQSDVVWEKSRTSWSCSCSTCASREMWRTPQSCTHNLTYYHYLAFWMPGLLPQPFAAAQKLPLHGWWGQDVEPAATKQNPLHHHVASRFILFLLARKEVTIPAQTQALTAEINAKYR